MRRDGIDKADRVTLLYRGWLHHIGVGRAHRGTRVILLIDGPDLRIVSENGQLLRSPPGGTDEGADGSSF